MRDEYLGADIPTSPNPDSCRQNLLRLTEYIPTVGGRPHRRRAWAHKSNRKKDGRPEHGKAIPALRRYLVGMSKRGGGRRPWVEVDLNRVFNRFGYSLGWGRELFRRLTLDPFWKNLCKVRYPQKVLQPQDGHGNGCFVILIAFRPYLRWDEEPLFYGRDRQQYRHIRATLRGEDLEISQVSDRSPSGYSPKDCTVSRGHHYKDFSTLRTAVENNTGASAAESSCGFADIEKGGDASEKVLPTQICQLRTSLNKENPAPSETARPDPSLKPTSTAAAVLNPKVTMTPATEPKAIVSKYLYPPGQSPSQISNFKFQNGKEDHSKSSNLRRKAVAMTLELKADHWQGTDHDTRQTQVQFSFEHAYAFVIESLRAGYLDKTIAIVWQRAVHQTHADLTDEHDGEYRPEVRSAAALNLFHARRLLRETDQLSDGTRIKNFYRARMLERERFRKRQAKEACSVADSKAEIDQILAGDTKKPVKELFRSLVKSLGNGALEKAVNQTDIKKS